MAEVAPQLWISQTPNLAIGYHQNRIFNDVQVRNVEQEIRDWEAANQTSLRKLAFLIKKITAVVERSSSRNADVKYDGGTKLRITAGEQKRALPDDLYPLWDATSKDVGAPLINSPKSVPDRGQRKEQATTSQRRPDKSTASVPINDNMPFADVIDYGVRKGFRQIIRRMPTRLADYHTLCEDLKSRGIDVLAGRKLRDIMEDMRRGKDDWDPDERRKIGGLKGLARDAAFRLLFILILGEPESEARDQNMAYNATTFVVSHRRIFRYRTRKMVREAFEERYPNISEKQRKGLDKWPISDPSLGTSREEDEEDLTTEEEYYYDSDSSF